MPHRVPFCDLTDGFFKSCLTSRVSSTSLCTSRPVRPEAANRFCLAPLLGIEELRSGPCHPGAFFSTPSSKFRNSRRQILSIFSLSFTVETGKLTALIMTTVLSDHDIDQLLSSAELSMASKAGQSVAVNTQPKDLTIASRPPPSTALVPKVKEKHELALRVPQLKSKDKKVRAITQSHLHLL